MDNVNKTLYIPLYGKSYVSKKGIILKDKKAEEIWDKEQFKLKGKSKSKWLSYYMGIRASVFDDWLQKHMIKYPEAVVVHIGCGMDSRVLRVGTNNHNWFDVDFSDVIAERRKYYNEDECYKMIDGDARESDWLTKIPYNKHAILVLEGISMYLTNSELKRLISNIGNHFENVNLFSYIRNVFEQRLSTYKTSYAKTSMYDINEYRFALNGNVDYNAYLISLSSSDRAEVTVLDTFVQDTFVNYVEKLNAIVE